jgi:hypothetical protein
VGSSCASTTASPVQCLAGTYAPAGATACIVCQKGYYTTSSGAGSCTACPAGSYCSSTGGPITCPLGSYCPGVSIVPEILSFRASRLTPPAPGSTAWPDQSSLGTNTGTLVNSPAVTLSTWSFVAFRGGNASTLLNQEVVTSNIVNFAANAPFTFAVWVRAPSGTSGNKIIGMENARTGAAGTAAYNGLYYDTNGNPRFGLWSGSAINSVAGSNDYRDGLWRYIVGVFDGARLYLYANGTSLFPAGVVSASAATGNVYIRIAGYLLPSSAYASATDGYFLGDLAAVQVYNRALSALEIWQNLCEVDRCACPLGTS